MLSMPKIEDLKRDLVQMGTRGHMLQPEGMSLASGIKA